MYKLFKISLFLGGIGCLIWYFASIYKAAVREVETARQGEDQKSINKNEYRSYGIFFLIVIGIFLLSILINNLILKYMPTTGLFSEFGIVALFFMVAEFFHKHGMISSWEDGLEVITWFMLSLPFAILMIFWFLKSAFKKLIMLIRA